MPNEARRRSNSRGNGRLRKIASVAESENLNRAVNSGAVLRGPIYFPFGVSELRDPANRT
jgi:hypothetical protein